MSPSVHNSDHAVPATVLVPKNTVGAQSSPPLSDLHGRTVALHVKLPGHKQVLIGRCTYEKDSQLGAVLRVELSASAACEFVLIEKDFHGRIAVDHLHGCDYSIDLS